MYNPEYDNPYGTDMYGYETEEERRLRLAREQEAKTPVKQTITTDPTTGVQKVKIEGSALNLSAMNPATPTVTAPVRPEDIYPRMIQAESGGQQFTPGGQVTTSPKGAMGVGQIMPATAMQPGYGVTNIFDLAQQRNIPVPSRDQAGAQQLLANEQLNREFGQNYYNAMNQRFGTEGGVAAYNAGPGRVQANMQANQGQLNTAQLPQETQDYIQKVMGRMPQAQGQTPQQAQAQPIITDQGQTVGYETPQQMVAGAQTNAPIAPTAPQAPAPAQAQTVAAPAQQEQAGPPTSLMTPGGWVERFNGILTQQMNPANNQPITDIERLNMLNNMSADPNLDPGARMVVATTISDQMRAISQEQKKKADYIKSLETNNMRDLQREDRMAKGEGSWLRYFLYGLLGSPNAQIEKEKLFPELTATTQYITMDDGKKGYLQVAKDGRVLYGASEDGIPMTQRDLVRYGQSTGTPKYKSDVSLQDVEATIDGKTVKGRVTTKYDSRGNQTTIVESGGKEYTYDGRWKPTSIGTAAEKAEAQKKINLAYDPIIEAAKKGASFLAEVNAKYGTNFKITGTENGQPVLVDGNTGKRVTGQAGGQIEATTTPAQLEAGQKRLEKKEEIIGKTEGESAASDIKNQRFADSTYGLIAPIAEQIKKSTGSGIGSSVDSLAAIIGKSTDGAKAIQQLKILSYPILANVPRFEGPQSDYDVQVYKQAAGDFANDKLPVETRLAALQGMIQLLKKYDKEGKNDWSFGGNAPASAPKPGAPATGQPAPGQPGGAPVIIKREKIS